MSVLRDRRLPPDSAIAGAGHRVLMASALPGVAVRKGRVSRAVAIALRDAALGRFPAEERAWFDRIETGGRRIASGLEIPEAVRWMSTPPPWGRFLTRLVRLLGPHNALELGTGFGLSTAYQLAALELNGRGRITSFDLDDMIAIAGPGLERLGLDSRAELVGGQIEATLPARLPDIGELDFALVDHDHTAAGTLGAFDELLPKLAAGAAVVFDDIAWTGEMRSAWREIAERPEVAGAVGVRRLGVAVIAGGGGGS
jgi:predicted O-methyltransferase YrrM